MSVPRLLLIGLLAATALLYAWLKPAAPAEAPPVPAGTTWSLDPLGEPVALRVREGDVVTVKLPAGTPGEAHVHGLEVVLKRAEGEAAELTFTAAHSGRFQAEWHSLEVPNHVTLGSLDVYPR